MDRYQLWWIIIMKSIINRGVKATDFKTRFWCSFTPCKYPYKFGGIPSKPNSYKVQAIVKKLYGNDVIEGFKQAYLAILGALKDKDDKLLNSTLEPTLTKNLKFQNVQLVNDSSSIQVNLVHSYFIFGSQFIRTPQNRQLIALEAKLPEIEAFISTNMAKTVSFGKIPILVGFQVYFSGKTKLIRNKQEQKADDIQSHMLQFQASTGLNPLTFFGSMPQLKSPNQMDTQVFLSMFQKVISQNYEWKISDIDRLLNRNFVIKR